MGADLGLSSDQVREQEAVSADGSLRHTHLERPNQWLELLRAKNHAEKLHNGSAEGTGGVEEGDQRLST